MKNRPDLSASLTARIEALVASGAIPGAVVEVERDGFEGGGAWGASSIGTKAPLLRDARFPLGCLIKPLWAALCLQLSAEGRLDLNEPVDAYLPDLRSQAGSSAPSIAHLLSHTAGYVEPSGPQVRWHLSWEQFVEYFRQRRQAFVPGSVWSYTQTGHAVVAQTIRRLIGEDPLILLRRRITDLIGADVLGEGGGMAVTSHVRSSVSGAFVPIRAPTDGNLLRYSISPVAVAAKDILRAGAELARLAERDERYAPLTEPVIEVPEVVGSPSMERAPRAYALGLGSYGGGLGHNGSLLGATCALRIERGGSAGAVVALNAWSPGHRDELAARAMNWEGAAAAPMLAVPWPFEQLVGRYRGLMLGVGTMEARLVDGSLHCLLLAQGAAPARAILSRQPCGGVTVSCSQPWTAVGVGGDPQSGAPYFLVGTSCYVREDETGADAGI